jgi:type I restriction enzyme S subunit
MIWPTVQLDSIAVLDRQSVHPTEAEPETCYLGLEHVDGDGNIGCRETVASAALKSNKFRFSNQHVLFGKLRPYLRKIARPQFSGVCSTDIIPILPKNGMSRDYLYHLLRTRPMVDLATNRSSGANLPRLSPKQLATFPILLPPLPEQKRIAAILDAADALRVKRRESLQQLDQLLQSTFLEMFGDPVTNPKCPVIALGEYLIFVTSGGRGWAKYYNSKGARFIRSLDVQMNSISDSEMVLVNPPDNAEAKRTRVKKDDILLTITGSRIGRVARAPGSLEGSFISQHVAILRLGNGLLPEFVSRFLSLDGGGQLQIAKMQYGQTKPGLNFRQIKSFQVPVPKIEDQQRFATLVESIEQQKARCRAQLDELDTLFASLQSRAFNGEL